MVFVRAEQVDLVLEKGEFQLTVAERKKKTEEKTSQIVTFIVTHFVEPKTNRNIPPDRVRNAFDQIKGLKIDPFRSPTLSCLLTRIIFLYCLRTSPRDIPPLCLSICKLGQRILDWPNLCRHLHAASLRHRSSESQALELVKKIKDTLPLSKNVNNHKTGEPVAPEPDKCARTLGSVRTSPIMSARQRAVSCVIALQ